MYCLVVKPHDIAMTSHVDTSMTSTYWLDWPRPWAWDPVDIVHYNRGRGSRKFTRVDQCCEKVNPSAKKQKPKFDGSLSWLYPLADDDAVRRNVLLVKLLFSLCCPIFVDHNAMNGLQLRACATLSLFFAGKSSLKRVLFFFIFTIAHGFCHAAITLDLHFMCHGDHYNVVSTIFTFNAMVIKEAVGSKHVHILNIIVVGPECVTQSWMKTTTRLGACSAIHKVRDRCQSQSFRHQHTVLLTATQKVQEEIEILYHNNEKLLKFKRLQSYFKKSKWM